MTTTTTPQRRSVEERVALGRDARTLTPRSAHAGWSEPSGRRDPVRLLEEQDADRLAWLVPVRHARMQVSPFTFYRGTAAIMAADLATTPDSGLHVQLGGDAHLSNFGAYASPERQLVFDANDFDETLPGPWEWDVKRLATSFAVGGQQLEMDRKAVRDAVRTATATSVRSYREAMARYAQSGFLEQWYDYLTIEAIQVSGPRRSDLQKRLRRYADRARSRTSLQALAKLTEEVDGRLRFRSDPPLLVPMSELPPEFEPTEMQHVVEAGFETYKASLPDDVRYLVERYTPLDMALKVVGVGSVGTRCFVMLLQGRDRKDPLFLQVKESGPSVLEKHLGPSAYPNSGRRVVEGQRLAQAQSDIFLGWTEGRARRGFYVRQLRDWKGSMQESGATLERMVMYADLCGRTLARGHARSGDPIAIASYLGKGEAFDRAVTSFAEEYADQNRRDYDAFVTAIHDGRLEAADPDVASG